MTLLFKDIMMTQFEEKPELNGQSTDKIVKEKERRSQTKLMPRKSFTNKSYKRCKGGTRNK
jgi:hypothetical protein